MFVVLMVFFVPSFFVAGLITPVDAGSLGSQLVAYSLPATHFIVISRAVFLKGLDVALLGPRPLLLVGMGLGSVAISTWLFRKRLG